MDNWLETTGKFLKGEAIMPQEELSDNSCKVSKQGVNVQPSRVKALAMTASILLRHSHPNIPNRYSCNPLVDRTSTPVEWIDFANLQASKLQQWICRRDNRRAAKAMQFLTHGYGLDPAEILKSAMFSEDYSEMVIVKDIEVYSLCEHHILPFFGKAHIAYIPNGYIVGLSKIPRIVDAFARRLQVQERLTHDILECIDKTLNPKGVAVVIEASHMCMMMRGVQKQNSIMKTSSMLGNFRSNQATRTEFLSLVTG